MHFSLFSIVSGLHASFPFWWILHNDDSSLTLMLVWFCLMTGDCWQNLTPQPHNFTHSCFFLTARNTANSAACASRTTTTTAFSSTAVSAGAITASSSSSSCLWWWPTFSLLPRQQPTCWTRFLRVAAACGGGSRCWVGSSGWWAWWAWMPWRCCGRCGCWGSSLTPWPRGRPPTSGRGRA